MVGKVCRAWNTFVWVAGYANVFFGSSAAWLLKSGVYIPGGMIASNCITPGHFSENEQKDANRGTPALQHITVFWKALRILTTREEFKCLSPALPMPPWKARCKEVRDAIEVAGRYLTAAHTAPLPKRLTIYFNA